MNLEERLDGKKLGFGSGSKTGLNICSASELNLMFDTFLNAGFAYFEAALAYNNEEVFRKHLVKRHNRASFLLANKIPVGWGNRYTRKQFMDVFHASLKSCGVDYFDFYMLHNLGAKEYRAFKEPDCFEFLAEVKEKGLASYIGFSFHDTADVLDEILCKHHQTLDFVQLQINYADWDSRIIQSRECYETAARHNLPVFAMVPAKGGLLLNLPDTAMEIFKQANAEYSPVAWAYGFAASLENVAIVLSGMKNAEQVRENVEIMRKFQSAGFGDIEKDAIAKVRDELKRTVTIQCTGCAYCVPVCPKKIPIPNLLDFLNNGQSIGASIMFSRLYNATDGGQVAGGIKGGCVKCMKCESVCPQKLPIAELIGKVYELYDKPPRSKLKRAVKQILRHFGLYSFARRVWRRVSGKR